MARLVRLAGVGVVGVVLMGLAAAGFSALHAEGAQAGPAFRLVPSSQSVDLSAGSVSVGVAVDSPQNVGSYQFRLRYDPGVLKPTGVTATSFISSSGRLAQCQDPIFDGAGPGTVEYGCGSFAPPAEGASASGITTLATVTFKLMGGADTTIAIEHDTLSDPLALPLCVVSLMPTPPASDYLNTCPTVGGSVHVNGGSTGSQQGVSATSTPIPVDQTQNPPPTAVAAAAQPTAAAGSSPGATSGTSGAGVESGGSVSGVRGGTPGAAQGPVGATNQTGVGKFGYGPQQQTNDSRQMTLAAIALAVAGLVLMGASAAIRRRAAVRRA